jgi:hypothetical protein
MKSSKMSDRNKFILIMLCILGLYIYVIKYHHFGPPKIEMLKNTKYTVGKITSNYSFDKANGNGYDYKFMYNDDQRFAHQNGEFIPGRKYLVAYDSVNIKNGFFILDKYDITDSLAKYHIYEEYDNYNIGWSLQKIPFKYDKTNIDYEVKMMIKD